jgi:hypothetical protein
MSTTQTNDPVTRPAHYTKGKIEVIDYIEDQEFGFHEANVIKYVSRARHKGKELEDLKKARFYLDRKIKNLEDVLPVAQNVSQFTGHTAFAMSATSLHAGNPGYMEWLKVNKPAEYLRLSAQAEVKVVQGENSKAWNLSKDDGGYYRRVDEYGLYTDV